jgi:hypothetical protein
MRAGVRYARVAGQRGERSLEGPGVRRIVVREASPFARGRRIRRAQRRALRTGEVRPALKVGPGVIIAQAGLYEEGATYQHDLSFSSQQEIRYRAPSDAGRSGRAARSGSGPGPCRRRSAPPRCPGIVLDLAEVRRADQRLVIQRLMCQRGHEHGWDYTTTQPDVTPGGQRSTRVARVEARSAGHGPPELGEPACALVSAESGRPGSNQHGELGPLELDNASAPAPAHCVR